MLPQATVLSFPDPGGPDGADRETVTLKSGRDADKVMRRKPRLQARLEPGISIEELRKALNLSLMIHGGERSLDLEDPSVPRVDAAQTHRIEQMQEEIDRLRLILTTLAFDPLPRGVQTRGDALYVLGFQPSARPDRRTIQAKYRMLALIFHPDANTGDTERMAQINDAVKVLRSSSRPV
ncbi:MAG: J domain-containing protein [Alphaproteobacteria bacterium]|nr:J domain-containing protein [Alphaproteobacteria bacterium]